MNAVSSGPDHAADFFGLEVSKAPGGISPVESFITFRPVLFYTGIFEEYMRPPAVEKAPVLRFDHRGDPASYPERPAGRRGLLKLDVYMLNNRNTQSGALLVFKDVGLVPVTCNTLQHIEHRKRKRTGVLAGILTSGQERACRPGTQ